MAGGRSTDRSRKQTQCSLENRAFEADDVGNPSASRYSDLAYPVNAHDRYM